MDSKDINTTEPKKETLKEIMADLEQKVNPKSAQEGVALTAAAVTLNDPSIILGSMERGAKEFEQRTGRPMTYLEMRMMWG